MFFLQLEKPSGIHADVDSTIYRDEQSDEPQPFNSNYSPLIQQPSSSVGMRLNPLPCASNHPDIPIAGPSSLGQYPSHYIAGPSGTVGTFGEKAMVVVFLHGGLVSQVSYCHHGEHLIKY